MTNTTVKVPASQSSWSALISIIDKPQATFVGLIAQPRRKWILPVVISVIALLISVWSSASFSSELARQQMSQQLNQPGVSPEQVEQQMAEMERFASPLFIGLTGSILGTLAMAVIWLLTTTYFYFTALIAGAELKFGSVFLMVLWANLALAFRAIVQSVLILVTGNFPIYTSLAALQVSGDTLKDAANPLIAVLNNVDPFWFWYLFLLVVGLSVVASSGKVRAIIIVLIYALLAVGVGIIPALLAGGQA
jgi:hypothetical protein